MTDLTTAEKVDDIGWMLQRALENDDVALIEAVHLLLKRIYP